MTKNNEVASILKSMLQSIKNYNYVSNQDHELKSMFLEELLASVQSDELTDMAVEAHIEVRTDEQLNQIICGDPNIFNKFKKYINSLSIDIHEEY